MGIEGAELRRRNYFSDAGYPVRTRTGEANCVLIH